MWDPEVFVNHCDRRRVVVRVPIKETRNKKKQLKKRISSERQKILVSIRGVYVMRYDCNVAPVMVMVARSKRSV